MTSEFSKDFLPAWCERCNKQGIYFVVDTESPCLVIHNKCGYEILSGWCPKCGMGFALPNKPAKRPSEWSCPECHTKYPLTKSVMNNPLNLYLYEELPEDVRQRVMPKKNISSIILSVVVVVIFIVYFIIRFLR